MKIMTTIVAFFAFLALSLASPGALPGSSTRAVGDLTWPIAPMMYAGTIGGHEVQINGTIQEVHAQVQARYPDYHHSAASIAKDNTARNTEIKLDARNKLPPPLCCPVPGWSWLGATTSRVQEGIKYLNRKGTCDNWYKIEPICLYLASYAQDIINSCGDPATTCGQEFDSDKYNIIVRFDVC